MWTSQYGPKYISPAFIFVILCSCSLPPKLTTRIQNESRSQWTRCLIHRSAAARLGDCGFEIAPGAWMFFCCECCVLSGRGLCNEMNTRPEESYRVWCVVECELSPLSTSVLCRRLQRAKIPDAV
jgi:hypothetical protein